MRASTTPLLLLGAIGLFEPVNGYQIRRELVSWQADRWANLNPGSVYHGLSTLAADGLAARHDLTDGGRTVAVYELTDAGRAELTRLIVDAVLGVDLFDRRDFHAAFGLLTMIGDDRALELLTERARRFADMLAENPTPLSTEQFRFAPPHALRGAELWIHTARAEYEWLVEVIDDLRSGRLSLVPHNWTPPADDPGHQMTEDRTRYRSLIRRAPAQSGYPGDDPGPDGSRPPNDPP